MTIPAGVARGRIDEATRGVAMKDAVIIRLAPVLAECRDQEAVADLMRMLNAGVGWRRVYAAFGGKAACDEVIRRAESEGLIEVETHPDGWRDIQIL